jgi:ADP-ribose pyrophosphatase YjhB (NUDIX family)
MGKKPKIRPIAICVFRQGDRILVHEGEDTVKGCSFARPLGGGIEFGESSQAAVVREIQEELGAEITDVRLLGVVESTYTYQGKPGHEIVFVYDGRFADATFYQQDTLTVREGDQVFKARWRSLSALAQGTPTLVPPQLWEYLPLEQDP